MYFVLANPTPPPTSKFDRLDRTRGGRVIKSNTYVAKYNICFVMFIRKCPILDDPASVRETGCYERKRIELKKI